MNQYCIFSTLKVNHVQVCTNKIMASTLRVRVLSLQSALLRPPLGVVYPALEYQDMDMLEHIQRTEDSSGNHQRDRTPTQSRQAKRVGVVRLVKQKTQST